MVVDVESAGLHGPGLSWAVVFLSPDWKEESHYSAALNDFAAETIVGTHCDLSTQQWLEKNVFPSFHKADMRVDTPMKLRNRFWKLWRAAADKGYMMAADVAWPVEANFVSACIQDEPSTRAFQGPYPLFDIASITSLTPVGSKRAPLYYREGERPHDPLCDVRASIRAFRTAMEYLARR